MYARFDGADVSARKEGSFAAPIPGAVNTELAAGAGAGAAATDCDGGGRLSNSIELVIPYEPTGSSREDDASS